jgi:cysteine dioxygenase
MNAALLDEFPLGVCQPFFAFSDQHYVKNLLKRTDEYEVFLICWKAGQTTPIHDHPSEGCWLRVLQGSLEETEYSNPSLQELERRVFCVGDYGFKRGAEILHSIRALEDSVSVHVYYPPNHVANLYQLTTSYNPPNLPPNTHLSLPQTLHEESPV